MNETSKSKALREKRGDFEKYLHGYGIDIGCGDDCLVVPNGKVDRWDREQGNMEEMSGVQNATYDFVYASHALEHACDIDTTLYNWSRILKKDGVLYIVVPDYELYEHTTWPSIFNPDHKHSFSAQWGQKHVGRFDKSHYHLTDLYYVLHCCGVSVEFAFIEDEGYDYNKRELVDQTLTGALTQISIIGRKTKKSASLETHHSGKKFWKWL